MCTKIRSTTPRVERLSARAVSAQTVCPKMNWKTTPVFASMDSPPLAIGSHRLGAETDELPSNIVIPDTRGLAAGGSINWSNGSLCGSASVAGGFDNPNGIELVVGIRFKFAAVPKYDPRVAIAHNHRPQIANRRIPGHRVPGDGFRIVVKTNRCAVDLVMTGIARTRFWMDVAGDNHNRWVFRVKADQSRVAGLIVVKTVSGESDFTIMPPRAIPRCDPVTMILVAAVQ